MPAAVITGATKGLGRAIAEIFASHGFDVCTCARTLADLDRMQRDWQRLFPQQHLHTFQADMGVPEQTRAFAAFVSAHCPRIEALVNNTGVYLPGTVAGEPEGQLRHLMEVNLFSAYDLTRALLPQMTAAQKGHIFNMCSVASLMAYPNGGAYSVTKFALLGLTKVLREELKTLGIRVTAILPGATWSYSWKGVDLPAERLMQASDVAKMVWAAYTLSDAAVVEDIVLRPQLGDL
jgi:short-subunit dehydrogenase